MENSGNSCKNVHNNICNKRSTWKVINNDVLNIAMPKRGKKPKPRKQKLEYNDLSGLQHKNTATPLSTFKNIPVSPILNSKRNQKCMEEAFLTSPVLNHKRRNSNSDSDDKNKSPVISKDQKLIKLKRMKLSRFKEKAKCVRRLTEFEMKAEEGEKQVDEQEKYDKINEKACTNINNILGTDKKQKKCKNYTWTFQDFIENDSENVTNIETIDTQDLLGHQTKPLDRKLLDKPKKLHKIYKRKNNTKCKFKTFKNRFKEDENIQIEMIVSQERADISAVEINKNKPYLPANHNVIISQSSSQSSTKIEIIESPKCSNGNIVIEIDDSQKSSGNSTISNCTVVPDSYEKSSEELPIWSPVRKKKYKPGTLSHRFQRLLQKQKANVGIWKHELYLSTTSDYKISVSEDDHKITVLRIIKIISEFGVNILECVEFDSNDKNCRIIANFNYLDNVKLCENDVIKIVPPFFIKYFTVNNSVTKTFVNVHKIIKLMK